MSFTDAPLDSVSADRLAAKGLRLGLVDTGETEAFSAWMQADARGFYEARTAPRELEELRRGTAYRRTTGVWDDSAADAATPVATTAAWPTPLTVPGERAVPAWAISSVTVAPTHRRRGIARALVEAELRTAHTLGVPLAILTASEATIYSRYGFGVAAMAADLVIDTRRTRWAGPTASGRLHFVSLEQLREQGRGPLERVRLQTPGEIESDDYRWSRQAGVLGDDKDEAKNLRAVRYDDASGTPQGFALYRVTDGEPDFAKHTAVVEYLFAATDDAYAGLWRYVLELDLVTTVTAALRRVDEPLLWQVTDPRAVGVTLRSDHLWVRILDVPAALKGRRYSAPGRIVLKVADPLGFAAGRFLLEIDAHGAADVTPLSQGAPAGTDISAGTDTPAGADAATGAATLALTVNDLAALYLGGASPHTLVRAGRVTELTPGAADAVAASFRSATVPWLSTWF